MPNKYGIVLNGRLVRLCKSLAQAMGSQVYRPWSNACHVIRFSYGPSGLPMEAEIV